MPSYLSPEAAAHWPTVAEQLEAAGVLTPGSVRARALLRGVRPVAARDRSRGQPRPGNRVAVGLGEAIPYLQIADKAFEQITKLLVEFGMTPSSRSRVSKVKPDKPQVNPRAALLTRGGE